MIQGYFDKIYLINLIRREDRWINSLNEMVKWDLFPDIVRFLGVDGKSVKNDTNLKDGELGILLTHMRLLKEAEEEKLEKILILEDDFLFTERFANFADLYKEVPPDWKMLYLGGNHCYGSTEKITDNVLKVDGTVALHSVAIKKEIFKPLLGLMEQKEKPVDQYYALMHKIFPCYSFHPNLALQRPDFSDIQEKFMHYGHFGIA